MPIADGADFAGYTIIRLLGTGGMGEVYLARHPRLPRLEALKILPENVSADPEFRQRFAREADIASSLWHPHIVAVHDRGEYDGQLWIAMDYVDGTDAARLVRDRYPHGMPPKDALDIVSAIADALDYAHERYLLHRDVKPANILVTDLRSDDRRILLADFGIAKAANETHGITSTNMTVGSVAYAAPEQLTGKKLDGRADQYALACTAFHLLSGNQPFSHSSPAAVIGSHLSAPRPRLSSVRPDLPAMDEVLAKGMATEPYQRFETCEQFAAALRHGDTAWARSAAETQFAFSTAPSPPAVPERSDPVPPTPTPKTAELLSSKSTALIAIGVAAVLAVVIVVLLAAVIDGDSPPPPTTAAPTSPPWDEREPTQTSRPPRETVTETATVTPPPPPPVPRPQPPQRPAPTRPPGDLGLPTPISTPLCNGQGIVVLGNVTTPGMYAGGIQRLLNQYPGSSYLRTDQSCPSLRQADDEGDPIYAVYRYAGRTLSEVRSAVCATGGDAYGKWLDYVTPPDRMITC
ncbi:serine/threonine protein kinase [Mycolicibacterium novocastrense]|uniref:non-specific serine/threonine protein kinase n=1 Tax=Mycolicibacterium novocastrense TaxID=59813 RepID=A0AAW5SRQ6_MYCNV|nr:serine/threonine-protein kinase [Mycolicibacterium novocastrense]MCV7025959.1 serine/threonine protein kinase [Mycolicibacterium novocastrense]GAT08440.1 serine/threonine protein kinase [Mycolicibacterium novocastrense]